MVVPSLGLVQLGDEARILTQEFVAAFRILKLLNPPHDVFCEENAHWRLGVCAAIGETQCFVVDGMNPVVTRPIEHTAQLKYDGEL